MESTNICTTKLINNDTSLLITYYAIDNIIYNCIISDDNVFVKTFLNNDIIQLKNILDNNELSCKQINNTCDLYVNDDYYVCKLSLVVDPTYMNLIESISNTEKEYSELKETNVKLNEENIELKDINNRLSRDNMQLQELNSKRYDYDRIKNQNIILRRQIHENSFFRLGSGIPSNQNTSSTTGYSFGSSSNRN